MSIKNHAKYSTDLTIRTKNRRLGESPSTGTSNSVWSFHVGKDPMFLCGFS